MNIFVLDESPEKASAMLCDCHVRKMCIETAQILSAVMIRRGIPLMEGMPKPQNLCHPVIVAADGSEKTLNWVVLYNASLQGEYVARFEKRHAYYPFIYDYARIFGLSDKKSIETDCSHLAKCCGDMEGIEYFDVVTAYRKYYSEVKKKKLKEQNLWKFTWRKDWTEQCCGKCKHRYAYPTDLDRDGRCRLYPFRRVASDQASCKDFELIPKSTRGDLVRKGGDKALAEYAWSMCELLFPNQMQKLHKRTVVEMFENWCKEKA